MEENISAPETQKSKLDSSRLFQQIREQRGLAYDVYSHPSTYVRNGVYSIYAGVTAGKAGGGY